MQFGEGGGANRYVVTRFHIALTRHRVQFLPTRWFSAGGDGSVTLFRPQFGAFYRLVVESRLKLINSPLKVQTQLKCRFNRQLAPFLEGMLVVSTAIRKNKAKETSLAVFSAEEGKLQEKTFEGRRSRVFLSLNEFTTSQGSERRVPS